MDKIIRDIYQELRGIGLTHDHCDAVMGLIETLPIEIREGISNTKVSICDGIIIVEPNETETCPSSFDQKT